MKDGHSINSNKFVGFVELYLLRSITFLAG